jgi:hypothetical protein
MVGEVAVFEVELAGGRVENHGLVAQIQER